MYGEYPGPCMNTLVVIPVVNHFTYGLNLSLSICLCKHHCHQLYHELEQQEPRMCTSIRRYSRCVYGDYLKLFLHLENGGDVNEYTPWTGLLCGTLSEVPHVLYSSGPGLVLEFHTTSPTGNSSGFKGSFRFIDRRTHSIRTGTHTFDGSGSALLIEVPFSRSLILLTQVRTTRQFLLDALFPALTNAILFFHNKQ
ncbi:hypothetical protein CBL_04757 [Carabus blaptoides fortunei]